MIVSSKRFLYVGIIPCVTVLAFALRVAFVCDWQLLPYGPIPLLDAHCYDIWAQRIADGNLLRAHAFYQAPLFPYIVGILYGVFGVHLLNIGLLNAALGTLTVLFLMRTTHRLFGDLPALLIGILAATNEGFIFYTAPVMKETLGLFLLAAYVDSTLCALKSGAIKHYVGASLSLGLAILVRSNLLLLVPLLPLVDRLGHRQGSSKRYGLYCLIIFLCMLPVMAHNILVSRSFVPISYDDGFNFYIGHYRDADGVTNYPKEISTDPLEEEKIVRYEAEINEKSSLTDGEISNYWWKRSFKEIRNHPVHEMQLLRNKVFALMSNSESFDNYDIPFIKKNFYTTLSLTWSAFAVIGYLAFLGFLPHYGGQLEVRALALMVLLYGASVVMFYVTDRYRLSLLIFYFPLMGGVFTSRFLTSLTQSFRLIILGIVVALFFIGATVLAPHASFEGYDEGVLIGLYADEDNAYAAIHHFENAQTKDPLGMGSQAYIKISNIYEDWGLSARAQTILESALHAYPSDGVLWYNWGRFHARHGHLDVAFNSFKKSVEFDPSFTLSYYGLARLMLRESRPREARGYIETGLRFDPENPLLLSLATDHSP